MRQKYAVHNTMVDSVEVVEADAVDPRELNAIQLEYEKWRKKSKPIPKQIQFDYSWSLIRTKDKKLIAKGSSFSIAGVGLVFSDMVSDWHGRVKIYEFIHCLKKCNIFTK